MTKTQTTSIRRAIRSAAKSSKNTPIEIISNSADAPKLVGCSYYWTTPSGKTIVQHPAAYRWPTWYHASTLRVTVGDQYVAGMAI